MLGLQNIHSHTIYCDGSLTPEEMVKAAIAKGCDSFGFSGHSYAIFDAKHCMSLENTRRYIREIGELKEKYAGEIELFTGIEQDYYSDRIPGEFDFIIGSIHYIKEEGELVCVDAGAKSQKHAVDTSFGGDYYAMAERYFGTLADIAQKTGADIVGHFDLVTKYNFGGSLFDESHPRYVGAALAAMDEILKNCRLFEVNTGAMYRLGKPEPYPAVFLLKELFRRGGEVIITSDSHDADSICYKNDEIRELLKTCGFKYSKRLTRAGFVNVKL